MTKNSFNIETFLKLQSHERFADLFIKKCKTKIIVLATEGKDRTSYEVYIYNTKFQYYERTNADAKLMKMISSVLHEVLEKWLEKYETMLGEIMADKEMQPDDKQEQLEKLRAVIKNLYKAIQNIESTTYIKNIVQQVLIKLTLSPDEEAQLNKLENYINFRNYKVNLKTSEYSERDENDFVTSYLDYDFTPKVKKSVRKDVETCLKTICNDSDEDYEFIMSIFGYGITSETKEQSFLNVIGPSASNGKSTIIKLISNAFDIYVYKADRKTFNDSFTKSHKYFNRMKTKRIVYVEELDTKKIDAQMLKDIVDGDRIENEIMFGTTENIAIDFKLFFLSNNIMNFDTDEGIKRRNISIYFNSKFVDEENLEKEKETYKLGPVFVKDKNLLKKFEQEDYKNALVHILIKKAKQYFENGLTVPESCRKISRELCDENDKMKTFMENHFDLTNDENDVIARDEIIDMYNEYIGFKHAWTTILTQIKSHGIKYDKGRHGRYKGISNRGVIIGYKKKQAEVELNSNANFIDDCEADSLCDADGLDFGLSKPTTTPKDELLKVKMERDDAIKCCDGLKKIVQEQQAELEKLKKQIAALSMVNSPPRSDGCGFSESPRAQSETLKDLIDDILELATEKELQYETKNDTIKKMKTKLK